MTETDVPSLLFVDPAVQDSRYRIVLWAEAGAGKTVAACSAPGPILAVSADRPGAYRYARKHHAGKDIREVRFQSAQTLVEVYRYLQGDGSDIRTIILDPFGSIYDGMIAEIGGADPKAGHYQKINKRLLGFLVELRKLQLNVVLVAHERTEGDEDSGIQRMPALGGPKMIEKTLAEMDIVAWCFRKPGEGDELDVFVGQLVNARGRTCKDSTNALGRTRELNLTEWIEAANLGLGADTSDLPWGDEDAAAPEPFDAAESARVDAEMAAEEAALAAQQELAT